LEKQKLTAGPLEEINMYLKDQGLRVLMGSMVLFNQRFLKGTFDCTLAIADTIKVWTKNFEA
jgi:hypothetical protein